MGLKGARGFDGAGRVSPPSAPPGGIALLFCLIRGGGGSAAERGAAALGAPELRARPGGSAGSRRRCAAAEGSAEPAPGWQRRVRPSVPLARGAAPRPPSAGTAGGTRFANTPPTPAGLPGTPLPPCPAPPASPPADFLALLASAPFPQAPAPAAQRGCPARGCPVGWRERSRGGRGEPGQLNPVPVLQLFAFFLQIRSPFPASLSLSQEGN